MKQYKINIESRNYDKFTFVDVKTMNQIDTVNNINPLQEKLFNYDIVTVVVFFIQLLNHLFIYQVSLY